MPSFLGLLVRNLNLVYLGFGCESYFLFCLSQEHLKESNQSFVFRLQVYLHLSLLHPFTVLGL